MGRHKYQYGGAKLSVKENKGQPTERWITADPDIISDKILENLCSLQVVSSSSLCSMVLVGMLNPNGDIQKRSQIYREDGTLLSVKERADRERYVNIGRLEPYVCMKISLVRINSSQPSSVKWIENLKEGGSKEIKKNVTKIKEAIEEVVTQRNTALSLLCGENASDMIPDILQQAYMDDTNFSTKIEHIYTNSHEYAKSNNTPEITPETKRVVSWIIESSRTKGYMIHIAFMDYIDGFMTLRDFFDLNQQPEIQFAISCEAAVVIMILLLKGRIMSWDFHLRNLLTNGKLVKGLDLGRVYELGSSDEKRIKKDRHQIKYFLFNPDPYCGNLHAKLRQAFFNFFNLQATDTLDRFSDYFNLLLVDFPHNAYGFSRKDLNEKRKLIYGALIILAFIDGITNTCLYGSEYIQFSSVLSRVFNDFEHFKNFETFLGHFRIDYDVFVAQQASNGNVVTNLNHGLDEIITRLEPMLVQCVNPKRQNPLVFERSDIPNYDSEEEEEEDSPYILQQQKHQNVVVGVGGSNRRRRRKSNKKIKHKYRTQRRRKSTRRHR
jgi:hypothetical protein